MHVVVVLYLETKHISEPAAILKNWRSETIYGAHFHKNQWRILHANLFFFKENQQKKCNLY